MRSERVTPCRQMRPDSASTKSSSTLRCGRSPLSSAPRCPIVRFVLPGVLVSGCQPSDGYELEPGESRRSRAPASHRAGRISATFVSVLSSAWSRAVEHRRSGVGYSSSRLRARTSAGLPAGWSGWVSPTAWRRSASAQPIGEHPSTRAGPEGRTADAAHRRDRWDHVALITAGLPSVADRIGLPRTQAGVEPSSPRTGGFHLGQPYRRLAVRTCAQRGERHPSSSGG
jgi:hypothetical protein